MKQLLVCDHTLEEAECWCNAVLIPGIGPIYSVEKCKFRIYVFKVPLFFIFPSQTTEKQREVMSLIILHTYTV